MNLPVQAITFTYLLGAVTSLWWDILSSDNRSVYLGLYPLIFIFFNCKKVSGWLTYRIVAAIYLLVMKTFFTKMGQSRPLFVYFSSFLITISILKIAKSIDGVLGIRTRGLRMVGADETTELWRPLHVMKTFCLMRSLSKIEPIQVEYLLNLNKNLSICHAFV